MTDKPTRVRVTVSKDGPYVVSGQIPLSRQTIGTDVEGGSETWIQGESLTTHETYRLCRCGQSANKPFCDDTHKTVGFDGTETANRAAYLEEAQVLSGPSLALTDVESLCAFGRFCEPNGTVWQQVEADDGPEIRETFLRQTSNCPSGRLVGWDHGLKTALESDLPVSIGLVEDPAQECSGPIWLRGGISVVSSDGFVYEVRNRTTLCRCGQSANKPFCDGTHAAIKFRA